MRTIVIAAMLGILAAPAFAQTTAPAPSAGAAAIGATPGGAPAGPDGKLAMARVEQHISELHKRLGITPAQEPGWTKFATVMRDNAQRMETSYTDRATRFTTLTAVDDMKSYAAISRAHADNIDRLVPAFESVYASMTPEQRLAADKTFQNFQHGPGMKGGRRRP